MKQAFYNFSTVFVPYLMCMVLCCKAVGQTTPQAVQVAIDALHEDIAKAKNEGVFTYKEEMTAATAETFLKFSIWDDNNKAENEEYFDLVQIYRDSADVMAELLPEFERSEIMLMLADATNNLQRARDGKTNRPSSPRVDWSSLTHEGDHLTYEGRPVFVNDYTWKPNSADLTPYHGNLDGFFISPTHVTDKEGTINSNVMSDLQSKSSGTTGFVFISNKAVPDWAVAEYGQEFLARPNSFNFTKYDIDHPGAKVMMGALLDGTVPQMAGKRYIDLGYMLCNEPHWFTKSGEWATDGVTDYTIAKFKVWLSDRHTDITVLNDLWDTDFSSFDEVTIDLPMSGSRQGSPMWYDWCRFNMQRVTDYYIWMKDKIKESDSDAKVQLKIMPRLWAENAKDHGIDFEALTAMSDIIGNDAGAWNNKMGAAPEWYEEHYSFNYREVAMGYDFMKSVSPNKIAFNSESHYLSKNRSRNLYQKPAYARATYWLAYILGEGASQTWYWARQVDGSVRPNVGVGYAGSNNHQPRIVNEVAATMIDLNAYPEDILAIQRQRKPLRIFHSKTAAINDGDHMDEEYELYNALFYEGVSNGFVTENILQKQNHSKWDAVLVYETETVTASERSALQAYLDQGGTVIMDSKSILSDEYGRAIEPLDASSGELIIREGVEAIKTEAMSLLANIGMLPNINVLETNVNDVAGVYWRYTKREDGSTVLSLINMGNSTATVDIRLKDASVGTNVLDLLTGVYSERVLELKQNEVLLLQITDEEPLTGVKKPETMTDVLFPNPTTGLLQMDFEKEQDSVKVEIYDVSGALVSSSTFTQTTSVKMDISGLPTGNYIARLSIGDDTLTRKVIKL